MKKIFLLLWVFTLVLGCRDESLNPVPDFETAVHGYGHLKGGTTFVGTTTDPNTGLFNAGTVTYNNSWSAVMDYQWVSIDQKNTVNKIEIYVTFTEPYKDAQGNNRTADHGTELLREIAGGQVPANRVSLDIDLTPADIQSLFGDAQFNYDDGNGIVNVLNNTNLIPGRTVARDPSNLATQFIPSDKFLITWILYTSDGRIFDSWSDSVCSEFPGANCENAVTVKAP
jgi:hypothetical protein